MMLVTPLLLMNHLYDPKTAAYLRHYCQQQEVALLYRHYHPHRLLMHQLPAIYCEEYRFDARSYS